MFEGRNEDLLVRAFQCSLERRQREWIKSYCRPKSVHSLKIFVEEFLKHWWPKLQIFEDIYHYLLTALEKECLLVLFEGNEEVMEDSKDSSYGDDVSFLLEKKEF